MGARGAVPPVASAVPAAPASGEAMAAASEEPREAGPEEWPLADTSAAAAGGTSPPSAGASNRQPAGSAALARAASAERPRGIDGGGSGVEGDETLRAGVVVSAREASAALEEALAVARDAARVLDEALRASGARAANHEHLAPSRPSSPSPPPSSASPFPSDDGEEEEDDEADADDVEDQDDPARLVSPLLRPLAREWQSTRLGHVRAYAVAEAAGRGAAVLLSAEGGARPRPIGRLVVLGGRVALETPAEQLVAGLCWLAGPPAGRTTHLTWHDGRGLVADMWDCGFLRTARRAAAWVERHEAVPSHLGVGLPHLQGDAQTTTSAFTVGLCTAVMNRLWQLRRALPLNLLQCWPHRRWVRFHVVDFGSTDGTVEFLLGHCRAAIDCGLLRVYSAVGPSGWHASVAKNTAHMVAYEDILVNLDGDNLLQPGFVQDVVARFESGGATCLHYWAKGRKVPSGCYGRIACWREDFDRIRGYDEDCYPMAAQDADLIRRLAALPRACVQRVGDRSCHAIPNSVEDKTRNCSAVYWGISWSRMDTLNREVFNRRLAAGQVVRNVAQQQIGVPARLMNPPSASAPAAPAADGAIKFQ